jgi:hypothetical protein
MTVFGVDRFKINPQTCSVLIHFDPAAIDRWQLLEFLEEALRNAHAYPSADKNNHDLLICTAAAGLAAVAHSPRLCCSCRRRRSSPIAPSPR